MATMWRNLYKEFYFSTNFNKEKSCVIRKVVSNGATWSGANRGQRVFSSVNNVLIGSIKRFHYEAPKDKANDNDCSWIMREYTIDPTFIPKAFVLVCKIIKFKSPTFGYVLAPTDEELLSYYLFHKIVGETVPPTVLSVIDLYTQELSLIWQQCGGIDDKEIYLFTDFNKKKSPVIKKFGSNGATQNGENRGQ
ncbi:hypothetical protein SDJN03_17299, partial [Cucurbita argyrosperma subsp. sororia]